MGLKEIEARLAAATQEVVDLCEGKRQWTMCVPVQADDSDRVFMASLNDLRALLDVTRAVERLAEHHHWRNNTGDLPPLAQAIVAALDRLEAAP